MRTSLQIGQYEHKATKRKCSFGILEGSIIVAEAVDISVLTQFFFDRSQRCDGTGIVTGNPTSHGWEKQSGIHPSIIGGALPAAARMHTGAGGLRCDGVSQG
jgi:hypothetical protein